MIRFEWDAAKSEENRAKRGFSFGDILSVFHDPARVTFTDDRFDYGETRWITFGRIDGRLFAIAYTTRGETIRIISARKANDRERMRYETQGSHRS